MSHAKVHFKCEGITSTGKQCKTRRNCLRFRAYPQPSQRHMKPNMLKKDPQGLCLRFQFVGSGEVRPFIEVELA